MVKDGTKYLQMKEELYHALAECKTEKDVEQLLEDLCTYAEIENMAQRLSAARLIMQGKTYAEVIAETEISSATLSRVSRCVKHGSGGYTKLQK